MIKNPPTVITDNNGKILFINEAAHDICAALVIGGNISAAETAHESKKRGPHGTRTFYLLPDKYFAEKISYKNIESIINERPEKFNFYSKRRFSELYEALISNLKYFSFDGERMMLPVSTVTDKFFTSILPRHLYFGGTVIYREDPSISNTSVVFTEPCGLLMTLAAITATASSLSDKEIIFTVRDCGDNILFIFTAIPQSDRSYTSPTDFGIHAADVLYAEAASRVSGQEFTFEHIKGTDKIIFTLSVPTSDYYPEYLKAVESRRFKLDIAIGNMLYPPLTKKQDREHDEKLVIGSAVE